MQDYDLLIQIVKNTSGHYVFPQRTHKFLPFLYEGENFKARRKRKGFYEIHYTDGCLVEIEEKFAKVIKEEK